MEDPSDMIQTEEGVDTTTVLHHDLNVCTNSVRTDTTVTSIRGGGGEDIVIKTQKEGGKCVGGVRVEIMLDGAVGTCWVKWELSVGVVIVCERIGGLIGGWLRAIYLWGVGVELSEVERLLGLVCIGIRMIVCVVG